MTEFIPVQINFTKEQKAYLDKVREVDGIGRGPYNPLVTCHCLFLQSNQVRSSLNCCIRIAHLD